MVDYEGMAMGCRVGDEVVGRDEVSAQAEGGDGCEFQRWHCFFYPSPLNLYGQVGNSVVAFW